MNKEENRIISEILEILGDIVKKHELIMDKMEELTNMQVENKKNEMKMRIENEWGHQIVIEGDIKAMYYIDCDEKEVEDMLEQLKKFGYVKLGHYESWKNVCLWGVEPDMDKWVDKMLSKFSRKEVMKDE